MQNLKHAMISSTGVGAWIFFFALQFGGEREQGQGRAEVWGLD